MTVLCVSVLSGCALLDSMLGSKYDIAWNVLFEKEPSDNVLIKVDGYDSVPTKIPAGEEITFTLEGTNFISRVKPRHNLYVGDTMKFAINPEKVHIFDKETENIIVN